uniref:Uncharacterized protein n=1 Tax=Cacopsylla melanoneura TaxID=428564 RepID=A0A8D8XGW7_9HEMI
MYAVVKFEAGKDGKEFVEIISLEWVIDLEDKDPIPLKWYSAWYPKNDVSRKAYKHVPPFSSLGTTNRVTLIAMEENYQKARLLLAKAEDTDHPESSPPEKSRKKFKPSKLQTFESDDSEDSNTGMKKFHEKLQKSLPEPPKFVRKSTNPLSPAEQQKLEELLKRVNTQTQDVLPSPEKRTPEKIVNKVPPSPEKRTPEKIVDEDFMVLPSPISSPFVFNKRSPKKKTKVLSRSPDLYTLSSLSF